MADVAAAERFYTQVLGLIVNGRFAVGEGLDALEEVVLVAPGAAQSLGEGQFIVARYRNRPTPAPGEAIIGFVSADVDQTVKAALAAGAKVVQPATTITEAGLRVAFFQDPEGHVIEVLQAVT